jgi:raffinose/stachyose/melibiose transport system substrate-binding protein
MKLSITVAALTASVANGQIDTTDGATTAICIESWRAPDQGAWDTVLLPAFEAKHPNIQVTFAPIDKDHQNELSKKLADGTACDLIVVRPFDVSLELFNKGHLEDVTDMAALDNFSEVAKTAWQTNDGLVTFAIPMASVITGFIFNENAFNALAIEVPKTQDDFYAALDKLKEDGTFIPLAMGGTGDYAHLSNSEKGFMNVGPNYWNGEEGRLALLDGSQKLTDEQWVEPWRQVLQWVPYAGDNGMNLTQEEAMDLFMSGAAAVYPVGSWELQVLEEGVNGAFPMGVFKPPVPVEGDQCYIQDHIDMAMAINAASPHKEAAQTFLEWVGSEEFNILYANALPGFFPLSNFKVSVDNKLQNDMISWRDDCESSIRPFSQFLDRHDPTTTTQSFTASAEVTNGVKSPEDVAAEMQVVLESWYEPQMETNSGTSSAITIIAVAHKVFTATFVIAIFAALLE